MKAFYTILCLLFFQAIAVAQFSRHIVQLKDKNNSPYSLDRPSEYLSPKAIERRNRYGIKLDSSDLPVNPSYIQATESIPNVIVLNTSRWLNQVLIKTTDSDALQSVMELPFVKTVQQVAPRKARIRKSGFDNSHQELKPARKLKQINGDGDYFNYGNNYDQINIHEGTFLHNNGFRGEGMTIAVLDAGFYKYDTNPAFDSIVRNNQVLGTWDFVKNKISVTEEHDHGMICFSTIAANVPGKMVGTAPRAKYYLFRTEDASGEYQVEEQNWVAAAERADSLGVDLITSSLGYYTFDDHRGYSYEDMNGSTAMITRGAEYAFQKGMIITNSAGNSGSDSWHYIIAPADGPHVLAVGATHTNGQAAAFSSYGPSADGRVKPDIASIGAPAVVANNSGNPSFANGTSVANPIIAGLITCLWQAFPDMSNQQIIDAVKKSSHQYQSPDDRVGYGIPNMRIAYQLLEAQQQHQKTDRILKDDWIKAYPVPFTSRLWLVVKPPVSGTASIDVFNTNGVRVFTKSKISVTQGIPVYLNLDELNRLPRSFYWIQFSDGTNKRLLKIIKQ